MEEAASGSGGRFIETSDLRRSSRPSSSSSGSPGPSKSLVMPHNHSWLDPVASSSGRR